MPSRCPRVFFQRDCVWLARSLLGQKLVRQLGTHRLAGIIVETEAYLGIPDRAAHTYAGRRTPRNESMWQAGGHGYVYFTYGMHHCFNVVAGRPGDPVAVLVRALKPVEGIAEMYRRRLAARQDTSLCSGPARLCQALAIDRTLDGVDLVTSRALFLERVRARSLPRRMIRTGPRIGVSYAGSWARRHLRFWITGHPHVSG